MTTVLSTIPSIPTAPAGEAPEAPISNEGEATPSEAGSAGETAPEVPISNEPDPDLEVAKRFDEVARREARARKLEAEMHAMRKEAETTKAELARMKAELEEALEDPVAHYIKKGKDPVEVMKRAARPMTEEEKRIAKLEARIAEQDARDEEAKKTAEVEAKQQARDQITRRFVTETKPEEFPYLTSMYEPTELPKLVERLLMRPADPSDPESPSVLQAFHAKHRRDPTDHEIRQSLEHQAEQRATGLMERIRPKANPDSSQVTPETPDATAGSPSLSNQHAANTTSGSSRIKSRAEAKKELVAAFEAGAKQR